MDQRKIEPEGIAFTAAVAAIEQALQSGEKAMREFQRVNMTFNGEYYRPLKFDGERFSVEYEETGVDVCGVCGSAMHGTVHHQGVL